ncbi:MAG TPA: CNNM domain-containing protein, partial [Fimbriimonadaceae bacterium]|nr:CNNM domain-containing protein [Fimbriimonadaceae bacterium]
MNSDPYPRRPRGPQAGSALAGVLATSLMTAGLFMAGRALAESTVPSPTRIVEFVIALLVFVLLNGLFVASETAIEVLRPSHTKFLESGDSEGQAAVADMLQRKASFVAACSLGSMTMRAWIVALTVLPAVGLSEWLKTVWPAFAGMGQGEAIFLAMLILAIPVVAVNVVLGELVPRSY